MRSVSPKRSVQLAYRCALAAIVGLVACVCALTSANIAHSQTPDAEEESEQSEPTSSKSSAASDVGEIATYFDELEKLKLIDIETGTRKQLIAEVRQAEELLGRGATAAAAVQLFQIVESPRFRDLDEFVDYHNAEYYLGVALARQGAFDSALVYLARAIARGPGSLYFAPAHRRAIDIAIDTRAFDQVLEILDEVKFSEPLGPGPVSEKRYLLARQAYNKGEFKRAEGELAQISRKSRLYSSALYLRGVIRTRMGEFRDAAGAFCEVAAAPDSNRYSFVVDERYFRIKDLARLGLGRIAHEVSDYDDAYYHYFQVPEDSDRLPEALFEASWSMYQKRELGTARDLATEFGKTFPTSPLWPEAQLLAGYIELADCEFDAAQTHYDKLVAELEPIVAELKVAVDSPADRDALFDRALELRRAERAAPDERVDSLNTKNIRDRVLGLLALDPTYVRLHQSISGLRASSGHAKLAVAAWARLARAIGTKQVGAVAKEDDGPTDATALSEIAEDARALEDALGRARQELRRAEREGTIDGEAAAAERKRLADLDSELTEFEKLATEAAAAATETEAQGAPAGFATAHRTRPTRGK